MSEEKNLICPKFKRGDAVCKLCKHGKPHAAYSEGCTTCVEVKK